MPRLYHLFLRQKEKKGALPSEVISSLPKCHKSPDGLHMLRLAYYYDGSLFPWAVSRSGSIKASKMPNNYKSNSGIRQASRMRSMNPQCNLGFIGSYRCLPPSYPHDSLVLKRQVLTVYTAANYNEANTTPQAHIPPPSASRSQEIRARRMPTVRSLSHMRNSSP